VKAYVDEAKCPAEGSICPVLNSCPQGAVSHRRDESAPLGGRIAIDLERCDGCGRCVTDCCGHAIELKENDPTLPQ
jgi:Pyruvate/2-oxoacid:ferredoxin oxidoreductase delta subunit